MYNINNSMGTISILEKTMNFDRKIKELRMAISDEFFMADLIKITKEFAKIDFDGLED